MDQASTFDRTRRCFRATSFALVAIAVLVAAVLPVCGGICCPSTQATNIHAQMPCCAGEGSVGRDDSPRLPAAAGITTAPRTWVPVAVVARPAATSVVAPRVQIAREHAAPRRHELSPPLFLLNAQFLI